MSGTETEDRILDASPRKLQQARERGDVPISREGSSAGVYVAALLGVLLASGPIARQVGDILLPLLDQPDQLLNITTDGWQQVGYAVAKALGLVIAPFFILLAVGAFLPYILQGSITLSLERVSVKPSHLSPAAGVKRVLSARSLIEHGKSLLKVCAIAVACFVLVRPIYDKSVGYVPIDLAFLPQMLQDSIVQVLVAATVIALVIAGFDIPYQHLSYLRRMRMSLQEMKDEMRSSEGDPHLKARLKRLRRQRARRRMMQAVPKATVVITNPTHFAVALKYERGKDAAPIVVAKGVDLIARRIKEVASEHGVAVMESPPLARALHASVEIGETIPHEHFEAVAKIIGIVWAQRMR